jgi:uncharacterized membrane protein YphA (DoxX/SURF4 family)
MTVYTIFLYIGVAALVLSLLRYAFSKPNSYFFNFLQNFIGSLFIFSGFVKAVDPMGTSFKMHDYFQALNIQFMDSFSTPIAVFMIVLEIVLGLTLIIGWRPKLNLSLLLLMTLFFTFLTGFTYLSGYTPTPLFWTLLVLANVGFAIYGIIAKRPLKQLGFAIGLLSLIGIFITIKFTNLSFASEFAETKMKVTDCGCFGDFIKLKPWETFWKDVFLDILILILAVNYNRVSTFSSSIFRSIVAYGSFLLTTLFCLYNFILNEPIIDFRPYKIGSNLNEMRTILRPEKRDFVFIYENKKTGETKEFKTSELSNITEDWSYKDRKDIVLDPGIPAKINNLFIFNENQDDITDDLLNDEAYSLIVVSYKISNAKREYFASKFEPLAQKCKENGITFYGLSSEDPSDFIAKDKLSFQFYMADETPLKTIMRSNPGLLLLKNGVVVNKWHARHLPTFDQLNQVYFSK